MSRTDKTKPWRVMRDQGDHLTYHKYPCSCCSNSQAVKMYRRKYTRRDRTQLRIDLAAGREPSTTQHRHSALWDAW